MICFGNLVFIKLVAAEGLEPPRPLEHLSLSQGCLPFQHAAIK